MKQLLITIAAVLLVGCGESQQSATSPESKPVEPVAEVPAQPLPPVDAKADEPFAEASHPEPPTAKAPDISIHQAAEDGHIESVKQHLAAGTDVNAKDKYGVTPLHRAALVGNKETVELLIAKGADVNVKDKHGGTPLDSARFNAEIADLLRTHGGKSGAEDSIYVAAGVENIEAVKQHLADGKDLNAKNKEGATLLHIAATNSRKEIAELLITEGADVNAKDKYGVTPLHRAAMGYNKKIPELLIAKGADVNAMILSGSLKGMTPLDYATTFNLNRTEIAELLRKHGAKTSAELHADKSIHEAVRYGVIEAVKQHIAAGTDVNIKNDGGWAPLHIADNKEIAELLISNGADVNVKDKYAGTTPLMGAAQWGHKEIVELLISKGADVNAKFATGATSLDAVTKHIDNDAYAKPKDDLGLPTVSIDIPNHIKYAAEIADLLRKHGGKTGAELKAEGK